MSHDFQYLPPSGVGQPGTVEGGIQNIPFRSQHDAMLSGYNGFTPDAAYPDGYLGTIQSRRDDRFLDNLKGQLNQRSYQRGVHKGERVEPSDYFWPSELSDQRGLVRQAQGVMNDDGSYATARNAPLGTILEQMQASGGREIPVGPRGRMQPGPAGPYDVSSPGVATSLKYLAPHWK